MIFWELVKKVVIIKEIVKLIVIGVGVSIGVGVMVLGVIFLRK